MECFVLILCRGIQLDKVVISALCGEGYCQPCDVIGRGYIKVRPLLTTPPNYLSHRQYIVLKTILFTIKTRRFEINYLLKCHTTISEMWKLVKVPGQCQVVDLVSPVVIQCVLCGTHKRTYIHVQVEICLISQDACYRSQNKPKGILLT